ncbi:hypothetical protein FRB94_007777 [Tulasnella sp. JGI-2019a]|nr:hypothetical protein FRB94_007777 [Tulasnella sp. JGI-2019a]
MPNLFGTKRDFWLKYDTFADKFDKDMLARLNTNLDVLLIFAGLFSAVNTAFIVVALTALSANPADETNHLLRLLVMNVSNHTLTESDLSPPFTPGRAAIRQNCTFFASLCCSLLAAIGAVLAKQWLQSYERTGQTGPVDQQAVRRTQKFVGAEKWGLRPMVETLATLLLISLALFFVALIDYLWSVNETVAIVVLAFAAAGGLLYLLMVVLAAIFPVCPFQTGPSVALTYLPMAVIRSTVILATLPNNFWYYIMRPHLLNLRSRSVGVVIRSGLCIVLLFPFAFAVQAISRPFLLLLFIFWVASFVPYVSRILTIAHQYLTSRRKILKVDIYNAHSAILMIESASTAETVTTVADNILLISDFKAVQLIATSTAFETLLSHLQKSFQDFHSGNNEVDLTYTLSLARTVIYVMLTDPKRTTIALGKCFQNLDRLGEGHAGSTPLELHMLLGCVRTMCRLGATRILGIDRQNMEIAKGALRTVPRFGPVRPPEWLNVAIYSREKWWGGRPALSAKAVLPKSAAILWLHHCTVITAYNRWNEDVMTGLVEDLGDQFLTETLGPDAAYLSRVMDALLAILRWYPLWGARNGHPSLDDGKNIQSAWNVSENRPLISQLLDILDEFSRHYDNEDPETFSTFLRCQQRLLTQVNALDVSYDTMIEGRPLFSEMHSSLNSNLGRLLTISETHQSVATDDPGATSDLAMGCEAEVVRTLQRLLQTSTAQESVNPADLVSTARLALRVSAITEKEQLLQGTLYSIFTEVLRLHTSDELVEASRYAHLQKGRAVAVVLASTLRLYIWLHPSVPSDQAWVAFESFLRDLVTGDIPTVPCVPTDAPEAWDALVEVARESHPARYSCMGLGVLWFASRIESGPEASQQIEEGRLLDWFATVMRKVQEDGWAENVPEELRSHWTAVEKKCAGILFLEAWDATIGADDAGLPSSQLSNWTSSETIEAFVTWLREFDGQETIEIKLEDVVLMQVPVRPSLIARFVEHATLANRQITEELELQNILDRPRDDSNLAGRAGAESGQDAMVDMGIEECEWCLDGARCMHRDPVSQS